DVLQLVAVLVAGDQRDDDGRPDREVADAAAKADSGAEQAAGQQCQDGAEGDQPRNLVAGYGACLVAETEPGDRARRNDDACQDEQRAHQPCSARSRAMRARRVSRRGLRSTVASRAGSSAMISRRPAALMPIQPAISS